jgi:lipoyl(octanoyl) transferase
LMREPHPRHSSLSTFDFRPLAVMKPLLIVELGLISWAEAYALQQRIVAARKAREIDDVFLLCEHPHVITLGRSANRANLLASEHVLRQKGVELHATNRGGDITYHGPGQIVGYPVLNLNNIKRDVGWYVRTLEEVMIRASADFGVSAFRVSEKTGIWVKAGDSEEKLAAIGVHISRWVTSHGFAFNVSTDLRYFDLIVPCGIADRKATSLEKLLGRSVSLHEVKPRLANHFEELFSLSSLVVSREELLVHLTAFENSVPTQQ